MKIAILTQPLHSNYGGILQAYALQTVLRHEGHDVITLDRRKGYPSLKVLLFRIGSFFKCIIRKYVKGESEYILCNPFKRGEYSVRPTPVYDNSLLADFISKNIRLSPPLYSTYDLKKYMHHNQIDCVVVGSDQVWRESYSPWITNYFLDFLGNKNKCSIKRYAYAASFGVADNAISKGKIKKCLRLLKLFDAVSVREDSAITYLNKVFDYNKACVVLDPTLLLPVEVYHGFIQQTDRHATGVVSYILDDSIEKESIVLDVTEKIGKQLTKLTTSPTDTLELASISKWLSSFFYADFVVTDSFHGCVFSILFRKNFIAIGNKIRGLDRFHTLLGHFNLSDRLVLSKEEYTKNEDRLMEGIDYEKIAKVYSQLRSKSLDFIRAI